MTRSKKLVTAALATLAMLACLPPHANALHGFDAPNTPRRELSQSRVPAFLAEKLGR